MGSRSAPIVFLLLTACMAADGTPPAVSRDSAPVQQPVSVSVRPVTLPAIPRMRPDVPRGRAETAQAAVRTTDGAAETATRRVGEDMARTGKSAAITGAVDAVPPADDAVDVSSAASRPPVDDGPVPGADPPAGDAAAALVPGDDYISDIHGAMPNPAPLPDPVQDRPAGHTDDTGPANAEADSAIGLAMLPPPEIERGIDVESLFDGDVVQYCAAMWQMGEYIGAARRRGEPFKRAIEDAVRRIADERQLPLDNRLSFSGQVYGRLVYRLEDSHAALTFGTYVHFACLTVRGDKKIVPADPNAERLLNSGLDLCEKTAFTREELNDCIFRELTPVVDLRNS